MTTTKSPFDYSKPFTWLLSFTLAFFAWFGKITYDKLIKIDDKVNELLVMQGIDRTEIQNLKDRKTVPPIKKDYSYSPLNREANVPEKQQY